MSLKVGFCVDLGLKRLILFLNPLLTLFLAISPRSFAWVFLLLFSPVLWFWLRNRSVFFS